MFVTITDQEKRQTICYDEIMRIERKAHFLQLWDSAGQGFRLEIKGDVFIKIDKGVTV